MSFQKTNKNVSEDVSEKLSTQLHGAILGHICWCFLNLGKNCLELEIQTSVVEICLFK